MPEPESSSQGPPRAASTRLLLLLGAAAGAALFMGALYLTFATEDMWDRLWHLSLIVLFTAAIVPVVVAWMRLQRIELSGAYRLLRSNHAGLLRAERLASAGMVAGMAVHEINNPVSVILGHVYLMKEQGKDPALRGHPAWGGISRSMDAVEKAAKQIQATTQGLLGFLHPGLMPEGAVDFNRVVEDILRLVAPQLSAGGVRVVRDLAPALPPLRGNPREFQQVLMNLVLNSLQAMPGGGELTLRTRALGDCVEVAVADTGTGIAEEIQRRVFDPFFTTKPQGTGLGLALVHSVVQKRGGSVEFRSPAGGGTTFVLRFPASPPEAPPPAPRPAPPPEGPK